MISKTCFNNIFVLVKSWCMKYWQQLGQETVAQHTVSVISKLLLRYPLVIFHVAMDITIFQWVNRRESS